MFHFNCFFSIFTGLHEFDSLKNPEVNSFRSRMKQLADDEIRKRQHKSWFERLLYQFPPRLTAADATLSRHILSRLKDGNFVILIKFDNTEVCWDFSFYVSTKISLFLLNSSMYFVWNSFTIHSFKFYGSMYYLFKLLLKCLVFVEPLRTSPQAPERCHF